MSLVQEHILASIHSHCEPEVGQIQSRSRLSCEEKQTSSLEKDQIYLDDHSK